MEDGGAGTENVRNRKLPDGRERRIAHVKFERRNSSPIGSGVKLVRGAGLEPASLAAKDPKSFAFANFASRAKKGVPTSAGTR